MTIEELEKKLNDLEQVASDKERKLTKVELMNLLYDLMSICSDLSEHFFNLRMYFHYESALGKAEAYRIALNLVDMEVQNNG